MAEAREVWGAEVSMLTLADALREQGVEVALVCLEGELAERSRAAGITTYVADAPPASEGVDAGRRLWTQYVRHARAGDRLVLFAYILVAWAPVFRPLLAPRGVRIALDLHDQLETPKSFWSVRLASRAVDSVIACSAFTAAQLGDRPGVHSLHRPVTRRRSHASTARRDRAAGRVAFGASAPEPRAQTAEVRPFRVGIVGRISPEKHHHVLIDAVSLLDRPAELVVRGRVFGAAQEYAGQVAAHGRAMLGARFVDEGRVPAEVALDGLDAAVVANPAEPMGRTVLEAQLAGVVAVVPDTGGSAELVEDGVTGLIYRADDPVDLAGALRRLIDTPALAEEIRLRAPYSVAGPAEYAEAYLSRLG